MSGTGETGENGQSGSATDSTGSDRRFLHLVGSVFCLGFGVVIASAHLAVRVCRRLRHGLGGLRAHPAGRSLSTGSPAGRRLVTGPGLMYSQAWVRVDGKVPKARAQAPCDRTI